jgi:hypothetical protein
MSSTQMVFVFSFLFVLAAGPVGAQSGAPASPQAGPTLAAGKCEHGVKQTLCTRCNPKLEAVFKAKGDWCGEHSVPESQCAQCHPDLAKQGVQ